MDSVLDARYVGLGDDDQQLGVSHVCWGATNTSCTNVLFQIYPRDYL